MPTRTFTHTTNPAYATCRDERLVRKLVATDGEDKRFQEQKFREAPAIFPNNSVTYDVNKIRAISWPRGRGMGCTLGRTPKLAAGWVAH